MRLDLKKTTRFKLAIVLLILFFVNQPLFAQDFKKLDQFLNTLADHNRFMGSVSVAKEGEIVFSKQIGYRNIKDSIAIDGSTKFRIGSITKTFTAALVFKAVEEGKLTLTDSIVNYFPKIRHAGHIKISDLLRHTSGIINLTDAEDYLSWNTKPHSRAELLAIIESGGLDFVPGTRSQYSNSNYLLLTWILEDLYKQSYSDLIRTKITEPLKLQNTHVGGKIDVSANEANSYAHDPQDVWKLAAETDMSIPLGAGNLVSTSSDLVKFLHYLFDGKILNDNSLSLMKEVDDRFGSGLMPVSFHQHLGFGHSGGIDGFSAVAFYLVQSGFSVAITSNAFNFDVNRISNAALNCIFGFEVEALDFSEYKVSDELLKLYVGEYKAVQIPLNLVVSMENGRLKAQASGQPAFFLDAVKEHTFKFEPADVLITFDLSTQTLKLIQGGFTVDFNKM